MSLAAPAEQPAFASPTPGANPRANWIDVALAVGLAWLFWVLVAPGLDRIAEPIFDEVYTFPSVREICAGLAPHEQTHPPLSKLFMALGYWLSSGAPASAPDAPWQEIARGARLLSPLIGALGLVAQYAMLRVAAGRTAAIIGTVMLGSDGLYILMSRLALTNIYGMAFFLTGVAALLVAVRDRRPGWLYLAGLAFGLGVASRWTAGIALGVCGLWLGLLYLRGRFAGQGRWLAHAAVALVVLPSAVYVASYAQTFWALAHGATGLLFSPWLVTTFFAIQRDALASHYAQTTAHPFTSPWWSWPLLLKPTWYYFTFDRTHDLVTGIFAVGNLFIWWLAVPAIAVGSWAAAKGDDRAALFSLLALGTWLPWAVANNHYTFLHYFFESVPAVCALVAIGLSGASERHAFGRLLAWLYLGAVVYWACYFFPLLVGKPLTTTAYAEHLWLGAEHWDYGTATARFRKENHLEDPAVLKAFNKAHYSNNPWVQRMVPDKPASSP